MRNEMKQLALKLDCYVLGASAFGVFIRWLQLQIAFPSLVATEPI